MKTWLTVEAAMKDEAADELIAEIETLIRNGGIK